ncbi:MAG: hypothetical protein AB7J30_20460 [Hyphomicrobium sp.]|uniref:hypothetical protein n=1 Tax=Hyphomicrobium sp. TaxID=82 RepID=UPI003D10EE01
MHKLIASLFLAAFAIALAGPSLADCSSNHGTTAQTPAPATVAQTPLDATKTTTGKTEPGTGG